MKNNKLPIVWTVAGSDSGAGAGLQADLKAFEAMNVHGCTVVAALTAQNSIGVQLITPVDSVMFEAQLAALAQDIPPAVIKVGMIGNVENLRILVKYIDQLRINNPQLMLVVDPVLGATTGARFASIELLQAYRDTLLPRADVITPNRSEAALLLNQAPLNDSMSVEQAAQTLLTLGCKAIVITGGDELNSYSEDYCLTPYAQGWLRLPRVATPHHHGTGCVFAASVAAALAQGFVSMEAIVLGKMATTHALRYSHLAGQGAGSVRPRFDFAQQIENLPFFSLSKSTTSTTNTTSIDEAKQVSIKFQALKNPQLGLYAVVDSAAWVQRVLAAGVRTVQLRIKTSDTIDKTIIRREIRDAIQFAAAINDINVQLFINDHWQIALEEGAYGVHLGQEDLPLADLKALAHAGIRLGVSTHCYWEVCRAWQLQPSYIACGPIYPTAAKQMPWQPQGIENVAYWSKLLPIPVVAIGGMTVERVGQAIQSGASSVAVIGAIVAATSPETAITQLHDSIQLNLNLLNKNTANTPIKMPLMAQVTLTQTAILTS